MYRYSIKATAFWALLTVGFSACRPGPASSTLYPGIFSHSDPVIWVDGPPSVPASPRQQHNTEHLVKKGKSNMPADCVLVPRPGLLAAGRKENE